MKKITSSDIVKSILKIPYTMKRGKNVFVAECVDLNIVTQGLTLGETRKNVAEAISLHLKSASELGINI